MNYPLAFGLFEIGFGPLLAWHCPRAALREHRTGIAVGRQGGYLRGSDPRRFRATIAATFSAGVMDAGSVLAGIATAVWG